MSKAIIGSGSQIDIPYLLETRLLIQANSGGGKSWAIRRLMEQTANKVQQIIIDPEGEFSSLREKFDYVICAPHDGDALAHPRTASLLARRLLETGVSAVIDIYDLKARDRQLFVRLFLDSMVNAPKKLWRPVLIVLDEAHIFAPEKGKAESTGSVIDIATRGRKRGQCLIPATQRLAKLHKDVAAECLNKMIGRTGLDIDVKRAADELGMTYKEAIIKLRNLSPGEYFVFGPAISREVIRTKVGKVTTTHPKAGQRLMKAPPAPSSKVKKILSKLSDLPREAEQEAKTIAELKTELRKLRTELTLAKKHGVKVGMPEKEVERLVNKSVNEAVIKANAEINEIKKEVMATLSSIDSITKATVKKLQMSSFASHLLSQKISQKKITHRPKHHLLPPADANIPPGTLSSEKKLPTGANRILKELASRYPAGYTKSQVAILTKFSPKGGTFNNYMSMLRRAGYIEEREGLIYATEVGVQEIGDDIPQAPTNHKEAMELWRTALPSGAYRILETIVEAGNGCMEKEVVADMVGMSMSGGTFNNYLSVLRRNGLVTQSDTLFTACDILWP